MVCGFCGLTISLGNLLCSFPLCLEMDGFGISFFYLFGYHIMDMIHFIKAGRIPAEK